MGARAQHLIHARHGWGNHANWAHNHANCASTGVPVGGGAKAATAHACCRALQMCTVGSIPGGRGWGGAMAMLHATLAEGLWAT